jgi:hypothetical protein
MPLAGDQDDHERLLLRLKEQREAPFNERKKLVADAKLLLKLHQIVIPADGDRSWASRIEAAGAPLPPEPASELRVLVDRIRPLERQISELDREIKYVKAFESAVERMKEPCLEFMVTTGKGSPIGREKLLAGRIERILARFAKDDRENIVRRACRELVVPGADKARGVQSIQHIVTAVLEGRRVRGLLEQMHRDYEREGMAELDRDMHLAEVARLRRLGLVQRKRLASAARGNSGARPAARKPGTRR